jgi:23S rRNA (guanosine2251-2'-O)-methyltransferase
VAEGAQEKGRLSEILQMAKERYIPVQRVPRARLDKLSDSAQGIAAEAEGYPYVDVADIHAKAQRNSEPLFVLILDSIQNPQNLGTLIRTAESVGVHGVVMPGHRAADVTPAVVSASAGATEHMLIAQANLAQALDELKEAGVWVVGLDEDSSSLEPGKVSLTGALAVVVGSEGEGLRPLVKQKCDFLLRLPMRGQVESLNAAVAGSIALYLAFMARNHS